MISIERRIRKQKKKRLWIIALILLFVISLLFGIVYLFRKDKEIDYYYVYDRLIASMIPGKTEDEIYNDFVVMHERSISPSHQEIANLIIAESLHYSYNQDEKSRMIIRQGTKYLLDIAQETYVNGYGLYDSWDAFGDGSVNPSDTSYTITNATVLDAFLDVLDLDVLENREREEVERLINTIIIDWCSYYFTEKNGEEGYFWYSNQKVDDKDSPNVSAEFAGVIAKALYQEPDLFDVEEKRLIEKRISSVQKGIVSETDIENGEPFWKYINNREGANDLVHHWFILEGIMNLRQYWQKGSWNWSEEAEEKSIDSFISAGKIYNYSIYENNEEEANLYGIGGALEYYSKIGDNKKAEDICLIALKMFKGLDMGEYEDLRECTFFVRGLATLNYGN